MAKHYDLDASVEHHTEVRYLPKTGRWRPRCSCGWLGDLFEVGELARAETGEHLATVSAEG